MSVTITILIGSYIPGYKAGGPVRSIENMISAMGELYNFRVITADRDLGDKKPYGSIMVNEWNTAADGKTKIFYVDHWRMKRDVVVKCNEETDVFYICGILNNYALKFLLYQKLGIITKPIIVAPMGSLDDYALSVKSMKKKIYICLCNKMELVKNVYWSASTADEVDNVKKQFPDTKKIYILQDFTKCNSMAFMSKNKKPGCLELIFISRIQPKKNIEYIFDVIKNVVGNIQMKVYGTIEDKDYWIMCLNKIKELPDNIRVKYCGELGAEKVVKEFSGNHLFVFPTHSENFGHVIYESLCGSCPVIISDTTPWTQEFLGQAGSVLPLTDKEGFLRTIQNYVNMDAEEYNTHAEAAYMCAEKIYRAQQGNNVFGDMISNILKKRK